jgi:aspartate-semialdehyde dehydrogenase
MRVAVVGAGAVGIELLRVLRQRDFPIGHLTVLARSKRTVQVDGVSYTVEEISEEALERQDLVFFAGTEGEKGAAVSYAPIALQAGAICIDNGSDFRLDPKVPLVVPEVNPQDLNPESRLIANPNCSTIQMVVALAPIHRRWGLKRVIVSTYQAVSGAGSKAIEALRTETTCWASGQPIPPPSALPRSIAFNVIPQVGSFEDLGYTSEEWKMVKETHKILHDDRIPIVATCVRVPVFDAHSESVYFETVHPARLEEIWDVWQSSPGIVVKAGEDYPMPIQAAHRDEVWIGRLRRDPNVPSGFSCWIVCDNLRKGAALNAVQIAECLLKSALTR